MELRSELARWTAIGRPELRRLVPRLHRLVFYRIHLQTQRWIGTVAIVRA